MVNLAQLGSDPISPLLQVFSYLGIVILVLILAYLSTKFLTRLNFSKMQNRNIKLLDKFFISSDKSIYLIKVEKKVYLLSSDKTGLRLLDTLNEEELPSYFSDENIDYNNKRKDYTNKLSSFAEKLKSKQKGS